MKILLAVDGSNFSEAATSLLIAQVKVENTEVRLLHVAEPFPESLAQEMGVALQPRPDRHRRRGDHRWYGLRSIPRCPGLQVWGTGRVLGRVGD